MIQIGGRVLSILSRNSISGSMLHNPWSILAVRSCVFRVGKENLDNESH